MSIYYKQFRKTNANPKRPKAIFVQCLTYCCHYYLPIGKAISYEYKHYSTADIKTKTVVTKMHIGVFLNLWNRTDCKKLQRCFMNN